MAALLTLLIMKLEIIQQDNSVNLNLNGGTLDVIDNEIRNYTVGSLNGNGSEFALDLDFNTNTADTFTVNGGNATIHFSEQNRA